MKKQAVDPVALLGDMAKIYAGLQLAGGAAGLTKGVVQGLRGIKHPMTALPSGASGKARAITKFVLTRGAAPGQLYPIGELAQIPVQKYREQILNGVWKARDAALKEVAPVNEFRLQAVNKIAEDRLTPKTASVFGEEQQDRLMKLDFFLSMRGQGGLDNLGFTPPVMEKLAKTAVFRPAVQDALEKVATQVYGPEFKIDLSAGLIERLKHAAEDEEDDEEGKTAAIHNLIKRACSSCGPCDPDKSWAAQFAGTPLHERALAADMEREQLNLARDEKYLQEEIERGQVEHEEGVLRVDKKRLELALAKMLPGVKRDYDRSWSDMFVGTPLHNTALQLDVKDKELDLKREVNYVSRDERNNAYNQRRNANDVERSRLELELAQFKLQQAQATGDATKIAACQKTMAVAAVRHKGTVRKKVAAALLPTKAKIPIMVSMGALGAATSFAATKARAEDGSSRMEQYFKNMETKHPSGVINEIADKGQSMAKQLRSMPAVSALIGAGIGTALGSPAAASLTKAAYMQKDAGAIIDALKRIVGSQAGKNVIKATEKKMVKPVFRSTGAANMVRQAERGGVKEFTAPRRYTLSGV
jgi:hypothetical protein